MNIPYQKMEISEKELDCNSIQIIELIKDDIHKVVGICEISHEYFRIEDFNDNYDEYYPYFGDVYDFVKNYDEQNLDDIRKFLKDKIKTFKFLNIRPELIETSFYENSMTLSQFKAKAGLIILKFVNDFRDSYIEPIVYEVFCVDKQIKNANLKYSEIIRILIYTLNENIKKNRKSNIRLRLVSKLDSDSPYAIAYEFNKHQINILNEFSPLFQAYLQLDSYKAFNYIHQRESHTFSMELNFMIKYQLLSTYENFFFVKREISKEYALLDCDTKITTINELTIFGENFNEYDVTNDKKKSKDCAMPLSINFMHEKSGHYKYYLKNHDIDSPLIYYKELKIQIEISNIQNHYVGESGLIIQNFICNDKYIINALLTNFIFGDLLSDEYFGGSNFQKLVEKVKEKLDEFEQKNTITNINTKDNNDEIANETIQAYEFHEFQDHGDLIIDKNIDINYFKISSKENKIKRINICKYRKKKIIEKKNNLKNLNNKDNF